MYPYIAGGTALALLSAWAADGGTGKLLEAAKRFHHPQKDQVADGLRSSRLGELYLGSGGGAGGDGSGHSEIQT